MSQNPPKEWKKLKEIRLSYLNSTNTIDNYWSDEALVGAYDKTFAQRIGWKWDAVLAQLQKKFEFNMALSVDDWGCGSGIASRKFFHYFRENISEISPTDRSSKAVAYAKKKLIEKGYSPKSDPESKKVLLISHVLTELSQRDKEKLVDTIASYSMVIWVEPGTMRESHSLIEIREQYKSRFDFVLPCPTSKSCPLLKSEKDWCHFFAEPPREVFHSSYWKEFNKFFSIDLRSLPLSFFIAVKKEDSKLISRKDETQKPIILGRVRTQKGYVDYQSCNAEGDAPITRFQKRQSKATFKELQKAAFMREVDW